MGEQLTAGQVFRLGQHTLWVILGPLTASVDWAKKTKVKVRITKREMTTLWKLAMIDGMSNYSSNWFEREREIEGEETGSSTALHIAEKTSIDRLHLASWHLQKFTLHLDRRRRRLYFAPAYCPHNTYTLNMVVSSHCKRL